MSRFTIPKAKKSFESSGNQEEVNIEKMKRGRREKRERVCDIDCASKAFTREGNKSNPGS